MEFKEEKLLSLSLVDILKKVDILLHENNTQLAKDYVNKIVTSIKQYPLPKKEAKAALIPDNLFKRFIWSTKNKKAHNDRLLCYKILHHTIEEIK